MSTEDLFNSTFFFTFAGMKHICILFSAFVAIMAQAAEPWRLHLVNPDEGVNLRIDLYEESITVPGMEMFGPMNGYLNGKGIYGVWTVTSFKIHDNHTSTLRLSNDLGSETQAIRLTCLNDSTYQMTLEDGVVMKKAVNRKLVKIAPQMTLRLKQ